MSSSTPVATAAGAHLPQPALDRRLAVAFVQLMSIGIEHEQIDDTDLVLDAMRVLRPSLIELDTFEAWIAVKRRTYPEAIRVLRNLEASRPGWMTGKSLLALCECAIGDTAWRRHAQEVLDDGSDPEACHLARHLLEPDAVASEFDAMKQQEAAPPSPTPAERRMLQSPFLRA